MKGRVPGVGEIIERMALSVVAGAFYVVVAVEWPVDHSHGRPALPTGTFDEQPGVHQG